MQASKVHKLKLFYKEFGCRVVFWQMVTRIYKFGMHNNAFAFWMNKRKHKSILDYLYREYFDYIKEYSTKTIDYDNRINSKKIWTIWWQGEETAPEALKLCMKSMYKYKGEHEIVVISQNNYKKYIDIPDYILKKVECGKINFIHFADVIRMYLLNRYGGMWLDATILLSEEIPEKYFEYDYFTTKLDRKNIPCISECRWNGTAFGGKAGYVFFDFMIHFFYQYWVKEDQVIDYFLIDYMTEIAYEMIPAFQQQLDGLQINNSKIFEITQYLNEEYNPQIVAELNEGTCFHKIQRRIEYRKLTSDGKLTFYGYLYDRFF